MLCKKTWVVCVSVIGAAALSVSAQTQKQLVVSCIDGQPWTDMSSTTAADAYIGTGADAANAAAYVAPVEGQTGWNTYSFKFEWLTNADEPEELATLSFHLVRYTTETELENTGLSAFSPAAPYGPEELVVPYNSTRIPSTPKGPWGDSGLYVYESTIDLLPLKFQTTSEQTHFLAIGMECDGTQGAFFTGVMLGANNCSGSDSHWYMTKGDWYLNFGPALITEYTYAGLYPYANTPHGGVEVTLFKPHRFDRDQDDDVDVDDLNNGFELCRSGPAIPQPNPECSWADVDNDGDVDQSDFGRFQVCYSGQGNSPDPTCVAQE